MTPRLRLTLGFTFEDRGDGSPQSTHGNILHVDQDVDAEEAGSNDERIRRLLRAGASAAHLKDLLEDLVHDIEECCEGPISMIRRARDARHMLTWIDEEGGRIVKGQQDVYQPQSGPPAP